MHILIIGDVGVGKSTLIQRLLANVEGPVHGFRTLKIDGEAGGVSKVYIHPAEGPDIHGDENTVGLLGDEGMQARPVAFEACGVPLLTEIPQNAAVLMDEIGYLESTAPGFCEAVLRVLGGPYHVLAAVKTRETPFLQQIRDYPDALKYTITTENREQLYGQIQADLAQAELDSPFLA